LLRKEKRASTVLAIGAVVHYTPDSANKWKCQACMVIDSDENNVLTGVVWDYDGKRAVIPDVVFDEQREQGTWHYVHVRSDTPWFEPWSPPEDPPIEEPPPVDPPVDPEDPPTDPDPEPEPDPEPPAEDPPTEPPAGPDPDPDPPANPPVEPEGIVEPEGQG
jgi:hypothetical protein